MREDKHIQSSKRSIKASRNMTTAVPFVGCDCHMPPPIQHPSQKTLTEDR